jgi:apolipoprotein N-acyltransferase
MNDAPSLGVPIPSPRIASKEARDQPNFPALGEVVSALLSAGLLILSFPNFDLWFLAWLSLVPLFVVLARRPSGRSAFILGWLWGAVFFYGTCYWLTYSMIRYGHLPGWLAYSLLLIPVALVAAFPAVACVVLVRLIKGWGAVAILAAPFVWVAFEWTRLGVTGQLWNAIGYSQAYVPLVIQPAKWGGVYAVGFMIVMFNAAVAYLFVARTRRALMISSILLIAVVAVILTPQLVPSRRARPLAYPQPDMVVIAVQPNVPMDPVSDPAVSKALLDRHIALSLAALQEWDRERAAARDVLSDAGKLDALTKHLSIARLVIWPESPMNFAYGNDRQLRELLADFAVTNRTSILFNSLESAPQGGGYNSALLLNEQGQLSAQYDKIRLMPFGEYVPLPRWMPGSNAIAPLVGGFVAGTKYPLMPTGKTRAGVFICFESAFPEIARAFTNEGAGVLINISNDGYLGPTPVMRQHLANAIFRAVENSRPVLRVTNTGLTAYINSRGEVKDPAPGFQPAARIWTVRQDEHRTFYTRYGEVFVSLCALVTLLALAIAESQVRRNRLPRGQVRPGH